MSDSDRTPHEADDTPGPFPEVPSEPPSTLHRRRDGFHEAVTAAGLDGHDVRGEYIEGVGWKIEKADPEEGGWTGYAPLREDPPSR